MQIAVQANNRGTLIGATAVLMWATLALLTNLSGTVPPFQLVAMAFTIAFLIGLFLWRQEGGSLIEHLRLPIRAWALGIYGLFGYHFFYFMAQRNAPAVEASLIAYLWPLLMVALSALLPGVRFRWYHIIGIALGFSGAAVLVTRGVGLSLDPAYRLGYLYALACAFIWASYSMLTRRLSDIPTSAVGAYCGVTAVLAFICHLLFEQTVWPVGWQWLAVLGLGLGPVGLAFYTWDFGVKRGDIRALGAFSYAAPLLSTILLIAFGRAPASWYVLVASGLIVGGAALAAVDSFRR